VANAAAGTFIATSGSQSGTHTGTNKTTARGTGAGTTELTRLNGVLVNANAITNGPAANMGVFMGTLKINASGAVDWKLGTTTSGGGEAWLGVWNMFNRVTVTPRVEDTNAGAGYTSSTYHASLSSLTNRISIVTGLSEDGAHIRFQQFAYGASSNPINIALGFCATNTPSGVAAYTLLGGQSVVASYDSILPIGACYFQGIEKSDNTNSTTFYGLVSGVQTHHITAILRM
jgi:hypothetical protein